VTAKFPRKEDYGLTSQLNRAVNSISLNIAEGSGKKSGKNFDYYLDTAVGSTWEVVAGGFLALDRVTSRKKKSKNYTQKASHSPNLLTRFAELSAAISHPLFAICH